MYWGDSDTDKIEKAYLNRTGRTTLLIETDVNKYNSLTLHAGNIYFTDDNYQYDCLFYYYL